MPKLKKKKTSPGPQHNRCVLTDEDFLKMIPPKAVTFSDQPRSCHCPRKGCGGLAVDESGFLDTETACFIRAQRCLNCGAVW